MTNESGLEFSFLPQQGQILGAQFTFDSSVETDHRVYIHGSSNSGHQGSGEVVEQWCNGAMVQRCNGALIRSSLIELIFGPAWNCNCLPSMAPRVNYRENFCPAPPPWSILSCIPQANMPVI